jgi:hypothetical protein
MAVPYERFPGLSEGFVMVRPGSHALKTNWPSGSQAGPLFLEEAFAARLLQVEVVRVCFELRVVCFL